MALLFRKKLLKQLKDASFKLNPYDPCMCNKMIRGKQMTIVWHVGDLKILHFDTRAVNKMVAWLNEQYLAAMVTRSKKHKYLSMEFDFSTAGEVKVGMDAFIAGAIDAFPEEVFNTTPTLAGNHLFQVCTDDDKNKIRCRRSRASCSITLWQDCSMQRSVSGEACKQQ